MKDFYNWMEEMQTQMQGHPQQAQQQPQPQQIGQPPQQGQPHQQGQAQQAQQNPQAKIDMLRKQGGLTPNHENMLKQAMATDQQQRNQNFPTTNGMLATIMKQQQPQGNMQQQANVQQQANQQPQQGNVQAAPQV